MLMTRSQIQLVIKNFEMVNLLISKRNLEIVQVLRRDQGLGDLGESDS